MKTRKANSKPKQQGVALQRAGSAIPASKLLRAEASRLDVLKHAMPDAADGMMTALVWSYNQAAAYLDSLGAPEKLMRYVPAPNDSSAGDGERKTLNTRQASSEPLPAALCSPLDGR